MSIAFSKPSWSLWNLPPPQSLLVSAQSVITSGKARAVAKVAYICACSLVDSCLTARRDPTHYLKGTASPRYCASEVIEDIRRILLEHPATLENSRQ
jgi:hypothetical protein